MIDCKCGKQWSKIEVEKDQTIHKIDSYRFAFLRTFKTLKTGFTVLVAVLACPSCRNEVRTA